MATSLISFAQSISIYHLLFPVLRKQEEVLVPEAGVPTRSVAISSQCVVFPLLALVRSYAFLPPFPVPAFVVSATDSTFPYVPKNPSNPYHPTIAVLATSSLKIVEAPYVRAPIVLTILDDPGNIEPSNFPSETHVPNIYSYPL